MHLEHLLFGSTSCGGAMPSSFPAFSSLQWGTAMDDQHGDVGSMLRTVAQNKWIFFCGSTARTAGLPFHISIDLHLFRYALDFTGKGNANLGRTSYPLRDQNSDRLYWVGTFSERSKLNWAELGGKGLITSLCSVRAVRESVRSMGLR